MKQDTLLYCGYGVITNVGNAFIDIGVKYTIEKAFPNAILYSASNLLSNFKWRYSKNESDRKFFDLRTHIESDIIILAGSLLDTKWFEFNKLFVDYLINSRKKVILLGVSIGDNLKNENDATKIKEKLLKMNLVGLVTRDQLSFDLFNDTCESAYSGIDNAFFVNDAYNPPKLDIDDLVVINFDKKKEPDIKTTGTIVRTDHQPWNIAKSKNLKRLLRKEKNRVLSKDFFSEIGEDYLTLYANTKKVYSNRVHACVATLAYGNKAQHFRKTDRARLFDRVGLKNIKSELVELDKNLIYDEKAKQIEVLKDIGKNF